jgi:integrator complex subunit 2
VSLLLDVITCQPPPTAAGVKFVSLGLCMLIACNSLLGSPALEKRGVHWIGWLVSLEGYFEQKMAASFGELLLLMAIHFHSGQFAAICDLVCQTLGMKVVIRQAAMTKMKHIFTQEIFTEQASGFRRWRKQ